VVVVLEDLSGHVVRPVAGAVRRDSVGILPVMAVVINAKFSYENRLASK
jgi:hypothetical protein